MDEDGFQHTGKRYFQRAIDSINMTETYDCENCGQKQTPEEYVAVEPSTPAARQLELGEPTQDDHHVVCEGCFENATDSIQSRGREEPNSSTYQFPDLDISDRLHLQRLEEAHGRERVIGWLREKIAVPLRYQFDNEFDEDAYYAAMRERFVNTDSGEVH